MKKFNCPQCGKKLTVLTPFCPHCGQAIAQGQPTNDTPQNWQPVVPPRKKKLGCLPKFLLIFLLMFCAGLIFGINTELKLDKKYGSNVDLHRIIDPTKEQAAAINAILADCGIDQIKYVRQDEALSNTHIEGETGYRVKVEETDNIILYLNEDKTVHSIWYKDIALYSDGAKIATVQDYVLTDDEAIEIMYQCENTIKSILKSPSTAKFPNILNWRFGKEKGQIIVQSYVDSQNSFGAEVRSQFQIIIDTQENQITSLIFDGEELMK